MAKNEVVIFDLDNCLADDNHRVNYIDRTKTGDARYEAYHANMGKDKPNPEAVRKINTHAEAARRIFILTARPVRYRHATMAWLDMNAIHYDELIMRPDGDHGTSVKVKRQMLNWMTESYDVVGSEIVMAYDDRDDVIAMYKSLKIPAELLAVNANQECCEKGGSSEPAPQQRCWSDNYGTGESVCYDNESGKVLGRVTGMGTTKYAYAANKPLGEYISLNHARRAVEQAL